VPVGAALLCALHRSCHRQAVCPGGEVGIGIGGGALAGAVVGVSSGVVWAQRSAPVLELSPTDRRLLA